MGLLVLVLIGLFVVAVVAKAGQLAPKKPETVSLTEYQQAVASSALRMVAVINESLQIANETKNADTKVSRVGVAERRLYELQQLAVAHPFINLTELAAVELSIAQLRLEIMQGHYHEAAERNIRGKSLEQAGDVDAAIREYEHLLDLGVDTPFTYRRLAIIYAKRKAKDEELRVLQAAVQNIPRPADGSHDWFTARLAKKFGQSPA